MCARFVMSHVCNMNLMINNYFLCDRLKITHAKLGDSGNYSCVPTVAERASVNVHVINGKSVRNAITDPRDKIILTHVSITYPHAAAIHIPGLYHSALTLSRMAYPFPDDLIFSHACFQVIKIKVTLLVEKYQRNFNFQLALKF